MLITQEIKDELYDKFIKYACLKCDAVMFVFKRGRLSKKEKIILEETLQNLKSKYQDDFLKSRHGNKWVFLEYKSVRENDILFFKPSKDIRKYLSSNKNLYAWLIPNFPEDIAFFKNGHCWFYSVTHERCCEIFCEDKKEYDYLKSIGINFVENEYISTPREKLYYENYYD